MKRLTNEYFSVNPPRNIRKWRQEYYIAIEDKLRELENIEEEYGCPLETVFKALTHGVYAKYTVVWEPEVKKEVGKFSVCLVRNIFGLKGWFIMAGRKEIYFWGLNEHGKTWALTKEELEK